MILQVLSPQIQIEMPHIWLYEVWWWAIKPYLSCFCDLPDASVFFAFPTRNQIWIELSPGKLFKNFKGKLHFEALCDVLSSDLPRKPNVRVWFASAKRTENWINGEKRGTRKPDRSCCNQVWKLVDKFLFCWKGFYLVQFNRWFLPFLCIASFWWKLKYHRNLILYFPAFTCAKTRSTLWCRRTQQEMCLAWGCW